MWRRLREHIAAALAPHGRALVQYVCAGPRPSIEDTAMAVTADPTEIPPFVAEVVTRYESLTGTPGLFRFLQLRTELSHATPE
ncbi:hypothetical protein [Nocardia sp. SSK8]|uniref:hypothetical protein n=1 Tax=Nocardia sp. SSK8 TaxID=3120154 RepID=UPI00300AFA82